MVPQFVIRLFRFCSRRVCFCDLGFPEPLRSAKGRSEFVEQVARVTAFLGDPWSLRPPPTVQVLVPRVDPPPPPPPLPPPPAAAAGGDGAGDGEEALSAQTKRAALQRRAAAASLAAEDYARRFESGDLPVSVSI